MADISGETGSLSTSTELQQRFDIRRHSVPRYSRRTICTASCPVGLRRLFLHPLLSRRLQISTAPSKDSSGARSTDSRLRPALILLRVNPLQTNPSLAAQPVRAEATWLPAVGCSKCSCFFVSLILNVPILSLSKKLSANAPHCLSPNSESPLC